MARTISMTDEEFELFKLHVLERHKMTREEARQKIIQYKYNPEFLNMLEALGLIKFDELTKPAIYVTLEDIDNDLQRIKLDNIIKVLALMGYNVEKKK